jgi:hypothetical protein
MTICQPGWVRTIIVTLKLNEPHGDVIENKGATLSNPELSRNVLENKGSYALKAGIILKRKEIEGANSEW